MVKHSKGKMGRSEDPRFAHVVGDLRFKPLRVKEFVRVEDDERMAKITQKSSLHGMKDPRGRKFNVHNLEQQSKLISAKKASSCDSEESSEEEDDDNVDDKSQASSDNDNDSNDACDNNDAIDKYIDVSEDRKLVKLMNKGIAPSSGADAIQEKRLQLLADPDLDYARGLDVFSDEESSSDDDTSSEEEQEEYDWGEQDKGAQWDVDGYKVDETARFAVCNIDWRRYKAQDIMMVLSSFAPEGGKVIKVAVYLSEIGKERVPKEDIMGPQEVSDLPKIKEEDDTNTDFESMRKYHFSHLKFYYAVAECNSMETSRAIYKSVDGSSFKNGEVMDLRYIPDDMTFDDSPESECTGVPTSYNKRTAEDGFPQVNYVKPQLTWEDGKDRIKTLLKFADGDASYDDQELNAYLAPAESDSDGDGDGSEEGVTEYSSMYEAPKKVDRLQVYRDLVANIDGNKKKAEAAASHDTDQEDELDDDTEEEQEEDQNKDLMPFEKYLLKRKTKQKQRKKNMKLLHAGDTKEREDDDRDIPDDIKNDPFFKEELAIRRKQKLKRMEQEREKEDQELAQQERDRIQREKDLALLVLDDDQEGSSHFDMRSLVQQAKEDARHGGKKRLSRWKLSKLKVKEKRLAKQGVVSTAIAEASARRPLPAAPVSARKVVEDHRFSRILTGSKGNIDPSHPEFAKHHTPFLDELRQEVQNKHILEQKHKKRRIEKLHE